MREKAERPESIIDRDDDEIAGRGERASVVKRLRAGTENESAAVDPHEDRQRRGARRIGHPDIEREAIFVAARVDRRRSDANLRAYLRGCRGVARRRPWR